jgi:hypothetical protein
MKRRIARFFAVWLFLGSLFPQTDLEELCKVPMLWIHYQTEHAELSVSAYLQLHYSSEVGEDCPAHDSLPMQKHAHAPLSLFFVPFEAPFFLPAPLLHAEAVAFVAFRQAHYRFQPENALFSPPKFLFV